MPVSRILFPTESREAIIYLGQRSHIASRCQPTYIGRAILRRMLIWHFSTQGLPLHRVTTTHRSLLHYVFTLTPMNRGGYFLWHCLYSVAIVIATEPYPLGSVLLYAVRTFLQSQRVGTGDNPAL
jgi:hypothetical protein